MSGNTEQARTLLYDIETAPNIAYVWGKYEQDVLKYAQEWHILCFAYRWLGENDVRVVALPDFKKDYKADPTNDFNVVEKLHQLFSDADIIVAHNGNSFDQKKTNARFLYHSFDPPVPYKQIDTCLTARKYFNFNSNKLGDLGETLGIGSKTDTNGFKTWLGCMNGDPEAWRLMKEYNAQDVVLLEQIYLRMRPWIDGHPNVAMLNGKMDACPKCGAETMSRQGFKYNKTTVVQQWHCSSCGGWSSSRVSEKTTKPSLVN